MSILETIAALVASKAGATVAGIGLAAASVGVAHHATPAEQAQSALERAADQRDGGEGVADDQQPATLLVDDERTQPQDTDAQGVAADVHAELSGDPEIAPEDGDEFGQAVAGNARENGAEFGAAVAEAASDGKAGQDDEQTGEQDAGPAEQADQRGHEAAAAGPENADRAEDGADNAPEDAGPPAGVGPDAAGGGPAGR